MNKDSWINEHDQGDREIVWPAEKELLGEIADELGIHTERELGMRSLPNCRNSAGSAAPLIGLTTAPGAWNGCTRGGRGAEFKAGKGRDSGQGYRSQARDSQDTRDQVALRPWPTGPIATFGVDSDVWGHQSMTLPHTLGADLWGQHTAMVPPTLGAIATEAWSSAVAAEARSRDGAAGAWSSAVPWSTWPPGMPGSASNECSWDRDWHNGQEEFLAPPPSLVPSPSLKSSSKWRAC